MASIVAFVSEHGFNSRYSKILLPPAPLHWSLVEGKLWFIASFCFAVPVGVIFLLLSWRHERVTGALRTAHHTVLHILCLSTRSTRRATLAACLCAEGVHSPPNVWGMCHQIAF